MDADWLEMDGALDEDLVQADDLRVGLTRPPLVKGVPLAPLMLTGGAVLWVFVVTGNPLHILIGVPVYGILRVISAKNVRIFAEIAAWFRVALRCPNCWFWGAISFSPRSVTKWEKW